MLADAQENGHSLPPRGARRRDGKGVGAEQPYDIEARQDALEDGHRSCHRPQGTTGFVE
jgi:hypothetical protein